MRAVVLTWFVALCAVTARAPVSRAAGHDGSALAVATAGKALAARDPFGGRSTVSLRRHGSTPDPLDPLGAILAPTDPPAPPRRPVRAAPLGSGAVPALSLVLTRSSRGPPG